MNIREYKKEDETGWIRCRLISFLDSAYYDDVYRSKEIYENPTIELVSEENGIIGGILDIEIDDKSRVCTRRESKGAMIWHIGVMPEYRKNGLAAKLLNRAVNELKEKGVKYIEAWTRDDDFVCRWYEKNGFKLDDTYLHVFASYEEGLKYFDKEKIKDLIPTSTYFEYSGNDFDTIKKSFSRVHECRCYIKEI